MLASTAMSQLEKQILLVVSVSLFGSMMIIVLIVSRKRMFMNFLSYCLPFVMPCGLHSNVSITGFLPTEF